MKDCGWGLRGAVLALAIALYWPLASVVWFESHESNEYVTRTVEYAAAFSNGDFYPRWATDFYGHYGSPFFNFYAPAVYWLAALFTTLLGSPTLGLKLVVLMGGATAAAFSFALIRLETGRDDAAFLGSCLFVTAPYRLAEVGWRGDLAELTALSALPMAMFAHRRIVHEDNPARLPALTMQAALAHAFVVLSHTLLGLWGTGILGALALGSVYQLWRRRDASTETQQISVLARPALLVLAFCSALLLAAVYTLPALLEKSLVRTETMVVGWAAPSNNSLQLSALFRGGPHQTGPLVVSALLVFLGGWLSRRRASVAALSWLLGSVLLVLLTLPVASPLWAANVIPFGAFIQFPWRLLGPAALCAAISLALGWAHAFPSRLVAGLLSIPLVAAAVMLALPHTSLEPMAPEKVILSPERVRGTWIRGTGLDEYLPRDVAQARGTPSDAVAHTQGPLQVKIERSAGTRHSLRIIAARAGELELQLHAFPGWYADTAGGGAAVTLYKNPRGLLALHIPAKGEYRVTVDFGSTPTRRAAMALSLLTLLFLFPLASLLMSRFRIRANKSELLTPVASGKA